MRFVILDHQPSTNSDSGLRTSTRHFDLMFEEAGRSGLRTFAVEQLPNSNSAADMAILADHRVEYLTYEGEISQNRGVVKRYAHGSWSGSLSTTSLLSFDSESLNFPDESWTIQLDMEAGRLLRIG